MKKLKLRKWVKVVLTLIIFISAVLVYRDTGYQGALAQTSDFHQGLFFLECGYLFFIQFGLYSLIWEN